jgi:hypothetical protein
VPESRWRWFFRTHRRRLWLIVGYGVFVAISFSTTGQPIVCDLIEDMLILGGVCVALAGLLGVGPLREKPTSVSPAEQPERPPRQHGHSGSIEQLSELAQLWWTGRITDKEFEVKSDES